MNGMNFVYGVGNMKHYLQLHFFFKRFKCTESIKVEENFIKPHTWNTFLIGLRVFST